MFSILVVDDEPNNFDVIETFLCDGYRQSSSAMNINLSAEEFELHYAACGASALASLEALHPDLILLDVMMPEMDGIEVCQRIKTTAQGAGVPIIMVTALSTKAEMARCLDAGADDFMSKPVNRLELVARVRSMIRIRRQYQQLESFNAHLESTVKQRTAQLQSMIFEDALTGLASRAFLLKQLTTAFQSEMTDLALVYLDCDQFKLINGSFGYAVGNQLLIALAQRLLEHLRPGDLLARMNGDEFCFLLHQVQDDLALKAFVQQILHSFDAPFLVENREIFLSASLGISSDPVVSQPAEEFLQDADTAMYQAKLSGRGSYKIFNRHMHLTMINRLTLESELQHALEHDEFVLYYQPIVNLKTQKIVALEALVRWQHPQRGVIAPGFFIPCLEATGLIIPLGLKVLQQACQQLCYWYQKGETELKMSVNLSVRQFSSPTLLADIDQVLIATGVNPAMLKFEITESAVMDSAENAIALMRDLRTRGIQISIDDFGTGYSSLGYLHRFPVDSLKIDRSFVNQIQPHTRQYHVVDTIVALGQQLNLSVIAEGIETPQQLDWLKSLACEFGQGYFFSKPLPADLLEQKYFS